MTLSQIGKNLWIATKKHSPEILTGIGIAGMITTTVLAVRATPKALQLIEQAGYEKGSDENPTMDMEFTSLTTVETIKVVWKCYIPSAVVGITSILCLIGASSVNVRRNAALATAYTLSETAMREYRDKVVKTIGEKKERSVRDAIAKDKIEQNPVTNSEVIITDKGDTLCFDMLSGRYFKSDIEKLRKGINELNRLMLSDGYVSLNDFYYEIGLENIKIGDTIGWNYDKGLVDIDFSSHLAADGTPCLAINFSIAPYYCFS